MGKPRNGQGLAALFIPLFLAGCSGPGALGTTATTAPPPPPAVVNDPATRVSQVAWTTARAKKCGFVLDRPKLKASYLGFEASQTTDTAALTKLDRAFDAAEGVLAARMADKPDYCRSAVVEEVRADLARYLAGDFTARAVRVAEATDSP
jgi:hypothetical protein